MAVSTSQNDIGRLDQATKSRLAYMNRIETLSNQMSELMERGDKSIHVYDRKVISIVNYIARIGSTYEGERAWRIMQGADALQQQYFQFRMFEPNPKLLQPLLLGWLLQINAIVYPNDKERYWKTVHFDISAFQGKMKALLTRSHLINTS
jgi:hypothetical protein